MADPSVESVINIENPVISSKQDDDIDLTAQNKTNSETINANNDNMSLVDNQEEESSPTQPSNDVVTETSILPEQSSCNTEQQVAHNDSLVSNNLETDFKLESPLPEESQIMLDLQENISSNKDDSQIALSDTDLNLELSEEEEQKNEDVTTESLESIAHSGGDDNEIEISDANQENKKASEFIETVTEVEKAEQKSVPASTNLQEDATEETIPDDEIKEEEEETNNTNNEDATEEVVAYQVIISEDDAISVNGMDQHIEESVDVIETLALTDDVQMLEVQEIESSDQSQQNVILPSDQVVVIEAQEEESYEEQNESTQQEDPEQKDVMKEEKADSQQEEDDETKPPMKIPCHVLGRNIDKPLVDPVRNGRVLLKPRLGVKIPYRNLTSQIVSKQEIAEEVMERARLKQSSAEPPAGGDLFFAKKLTQRLAKKIIPDGNDNKHEIKTSLSSSSSSSSKKTLVSASESSTKESNKSQVVATAATASKLKIKEETREVPKKSNFESFRSAASSPAPTSQPTTSTKITTSTKMIDNSDLIAILEGDDVPDFNVGRSDPPVLVPQCKLEKRTSDWEKEIALKQLENMHSHHPVTYKQTSSTQQASNHQISATTTTTSSSKGSIKTAESKENKEMSSQKKNVTEEKDDLSLQPRFSSSTPLKTYARKRKIEDLKPPASSSVTLLNNSSSKKQTVSDESTSKKKTDRTNEEKSFKKKDEKSNSSSSSNNSSSQSIKKQLPSSSTNNKDKPSSHQKHVAPDQKLSTHSQKQPSTSIDQKVSHQEKTNPKKPMSEDQKTKKTVEAEQKSKKSEDQKIKTPSKELTPPPTPQQNIITTMKSLSPNTYISKSSRIVKRKKIWDPDEATPIATLKLLKSTKLESFKSPERVVVEKEKKLNKSNTEKAVTKTPESPKATVLKPSNEKSPSPARKIIKKSTSTGKKKPKRLSEIDRLLMDEGAVNLLYAVRNTEDLQNANRSRKKKTTISLDKAQRELMNKTNEIKNDLQIKSTKDSPISLRKKEGGGSGSVVAATPKLIPNKEQQNQLMLQAAVILHRKRSKDSVSGSVHSPPASPAYVYSQHAEASRIIRRHSSSSFSSEDSDSEDTDRSSEKKMKSDPQKKKIKLNSEKQGKALTVADKQVLNEEMSKNFNKATVDDPKYSQFETLSVRRFDSLAQIILAPTAPMGQTTLSIQVMKELIDLLNLLEKDKSCRVIVLSSSGSSFCQGIDYKELVSDDESTCQEIIEDYASCVRNFLTTLTNFDKILVAGVHGNTVGLGVTMLPLFDMVFASDTATFSTPYAKLGCAAEGGVLLTLPHVMHNALASELFFASRKLTAGEALKLGLVTRTLWPDKFQDELISVLKVISCQSSQSMQAIKKQLRHDLVSKVESSLKSETSILIQHWMSNECQTNFSSYSLDIK